MTTSVLSTYTRDGLNEHDLQVIRDFALEAPWEWRCALEALIEGADEYLNEVREHEQLAKQYDTLQDSVKSHLEYLTKRVATFQTELAAAATSPSGPVMAAFAAFREDINDTIAAMQPQEEARSVPVSPGTG